MDGPEIDATLREVMSSFPTGVTIVSACDPNGEPYGLTVNSFTSVSLDPPLVLVCIGHGSSCHDRLSDSSSFSVNILSAPQADLARRFSREPASGRFDKVAWSSGDSGDPVIEGAVASLECSLHEVLTAGDHSILLGRVNRATMTDRPALLFRRGSMRNAQS
jgi:flavin reductase (DIM6/NTAB) family NADH-FMN oxidoreductase RutF